MVQMRMEGFKKLQHGTSDELERVIEKDDSNSSVTTESDEGKPVSRSCHYTLQHMISTNKFQILIVCLVILNCLLVITELLIDLRVFEMHHTSPVAEILHYMSIGILSLFIIEIALKMYVMRQEFFKHRMEVFDAIIVILTFSLDIALAKEEGLISAVGLLIVLRLWRITSILNGVILSVKVQAERRLARERRTREAVEQELCKFRDYCTVQEKEIEALQGLLRKHEIVYDVVERPVVGRKIDVIAEVNECQQRTELETAAP